MSDNIPLKKKVGNEFDVWDKIMKEVKANRYAGPYDSVPFSNFIQSPIGLVPKAGGQVRLIFHLFYDFKGGSKSVIFHIPKHLCTVKYKDIDHAMKSCLQMLKDKPKEMVWFGICDLKSAFRMIPLAQKFWSILLLKARNPRSHKWFFFVDKCLPFGVAISCSIFQRFSNVLLHFLKSKVKHILYKSVSNYLDDFLNVALSREGCNQMITAFHSICEHLNVPITKEKTIWPTLRIVFLGILLDGQWRILALPIEKIDKATTILKSLLCSKKATVKQVQQLTGLLNFLHKAIYPGRAFTRRMYAKISGKLESGNLKHYHHINLDREFRQDCQMWLKFLTNAPNSTKYYRPFIDLQSIVLAKDVGFHTDSSTCETLGFGGICGKQWYWGRWENGYIKKFKLSIAYLELYAVCVGIHIWAHKFSNIRLLLHCDNMSVVHMINNTSSGCRHCMYLIRLIVLKCLEFNFRLFAVHIKTEYNDLADSLSHLQFTRFNKLAEGRGGMTQIPEELLHELWPASKVWNGQMTVNLT